MNEKFGSIPENLREATPEQKKGLMKRLAEMPWVKSLTGAIGILSALETAVQASEKKEGVWEDWAETERLSSLIGDAIAEAEVNLRMPVEVEDEQMRVTYTDGVLDSGERVAAVLVKDEGDPKTKKDNIEIVGIFLGGKIEGVRYDREGKFKKRLMGGDARLNSFGYFHAKDFKNGLPPSFNLGSKASAQEVSSALDLQVNSLLRLCAEEYKLLQGLEMIGQGDAEEAQSLRRHMRSVVSGLQGAHPDLGVKLPGDLELIDYEGELEAGK